MTVRLRYELCGAGWADCTLEVDDQTATISASYLSDALDSLAGAVVSVLQHGESTAATFAEEPGEFRWQLDPTGEHLRVRIYWNLRRWNDLPHDPAIPLFDATCRTRTFAGQVLAELQRLLKEYGAAGYKDRWIMHDFPSARMVQLQELLA
jgi:hypothetical protein